MKNSNAATQLLTAHERELLELRTEVDGLKAALKQLRADVLVTFKHTGWPLRRIPRPNRAVKKAVSNDGR
jgi:hypothetical protein